MGQLSRHLVLVLALALAPLGAGAAMYLNWTATDLYNNADFSNAALVVLYASSGGSTRTVATLTKSAATAALDADDLADGKVWSDFYNNTLIDSSYTSASFYVNAYTSETEASDATLLFNGLTGNIITYNDLIDMGAISDFVTDPSTAVYWTPNLSNPSPEPSGGLLVLMGCAALALRRRRERKGGT